MEKKTVTNKPSVSIIVPVYNVELYLQDCIDSLINQDIERYEIILVDDGSTDNSGRVCDTYKMQYPDLIQVIHKENGGLGSARNKGLEQAQGCYILFVDSDDYIKDNSINDLWNSAREDNVDILLFGAESFSDDGSTIETNYERTRTPFNKVEVGEYGLINAIQNEEYYTSVCLRLYRKEFLDNISVSFNEKYIHEDEDFSFLTYLLAGKTKVIDKKIYCRR